MCLHSLLALALVLATVSGQDQTAFINSLRQQGFSDQEIGGILQQQQQQFQNQQQGFQQQQQFAPQQQQQFAPAPQQPQQQQQFFQQQQQFAPQQSQQPQQFFQQQQQQPQQFFQQQQPGGFQQQTVDRQRGPPPQQTPQQPQQQLPPRSKVFFDIEVDNGQRKESYGRITMELFDEVVPRTARNFLEIASGNNPQRFSYTGTIFHRIIPQFMLQGGDFENRDGTGGQSIYGPKFDDENFLVKHGSPGLLSMANSGPNTNGAQFFITTVKTDWLDGKHVVFGRVDDQASFDIVKRIEALGSQSGTPSATVTVALSGVLEVGCCCVADPALRCGQ